MLINFFELFIYIIYLFYLNNLQIIFQGYITYHVTNSKTTWKTMYHFMERLKETYECIEDFTVLSATLEQLFLQFARG